MGIVTALLSLFGCAERKKDNEAGSQQTEAQSARKGLTQATIDTTSDDELLQVIFDNLSQQFTTGYEKEYETVMRWNKSKQSIYMIYILEAEVNNGGYNQFYFNSSGQFYKLLPDALKQIGADKFAELMHESNDAYEKEKEHITNYQDGTIEGFSKSYEDNLLDAFDDKFYALYRIEDLQKK